MRVCVIGGTGHIGGFLVPQLMERGHELTVVSTGRKPMRDGPEWRRAKVVKAEYRRDDAVWRQCMSSIGAEVVIDILGNDLPGLYKAIRSHCRHLIVCGSVWMFGPPKVVPTPPETQNPCESAGYALRYREMLEVKEQAKHDGIAFTAIMPPNICGPGKIPLDNLGGRDIERHRSMMCGARVVLPERCNTLIGPCDAFDVAMPFALAVDGRDAAADRIFNAGSAYALTAPEFVRAYADIYGKPIPIEYVPERVFYSQILPSPGANFHFRHHMCPDISETREKLGYSPVFTPEQSMERAVGWMREQGLL